MIDADRIAPKLYIGGEPETCGPFDVVVLAAEELQDIPLKCEVIHAPLDDAVPTKKELETALDAAWKVYNARKAERAIQRIRTLRKGVVLQPLCNQAFVKVLHQIEKNRKKR